MQNTLSWYVNDTADLLRDRNFQMTSESSIKRYVNQARRQVAIQTGCIQVLACGQAPFGTGAQPGNMIPGGFIPGTLPGSLPDNANQAGAPSTPSNGFYSIPNVEMYPFSYANQFLKKQQAGVGDIYDVFAVSDSWGGIRPTLDWMPWNDFQAYGRSYNIGAFAYPFVWSSLGTGTRGQVWLFPAPSTAQEMEWQCSCLPIDLIDDDTPEAIPDPYTSAVKFYAAYLAYLATQRHGQATLMTGEFNNQLDIAASAASGTKISSSYPYAGP